MSANTGKAALQGASYLSLATFRRDGREVATPVWFAADPEAAARLYVFTAGDSGKVKRLRNSSRSKVAACDVRGRLRGDWVDANTTILTDRAAIARAYDALRRKYGFQMWLTDLMSRISGRINRRAMLEIDVT